ncbi:diguanylate cyclase (GGDEF)-like protein [Catenuloplanes nepalensis]|uniref:Diguanylate cyclase (GGDEF)-like protein n=1 Tax=Catenuloplanes nepalensis TaxID=587533 RepID=A0ABT9MX90_9ACTN|nr:GGDEF domain-containing protein [Catenuloplanes nepalensis]MDP9796062.1 diguanylate cyclase (GGDEF)-like protein [Catenuloplanes nepalensis]
MTSLPEAPLAEQVQRLMADVYLSHEGLLERADELAEAAEQAGDRCWADLARLVGADVHNRGGRASEAVTLARQILATTRDRLVRAHAHCVIAGGLWRLGDSDRALRHAIRAMRALKEEDPPALLADHSLVLAALLNDRRPGPLSAEEFRTAQRYVEASGQPPMIIANLNNWAWCAYRDGDLTTATALVKRLRACAAENAVALNSSTADTVARVLLGNGERDEAMRILEYALEHAPPTESDAVPAALVTLAEFQFRDGDYAGGLRTLARSRVVGARHGASDTGVAALRMVAQGHAELGEFEAAYRAMVEFHDAWTELRSQQSELLTRFAQAQFAVEEASRDSARFRELAERDPLTGLPNRRGFDAGLRAALAGTDPLCVALLDLDHFKQVNDTYSHAVGDDVLRHIAELLATVPGIAGRQGGEEFILMFRSDLDAAVAACESLRQSVENHTWSRVATGLSVTASIGVTEIRPGEEPTAAFSRADALLYSAKHAGRNRVSST